MKLIGGKMIKRSSFNRILALVAIVATLFIVHFSNEYLSQHATHHCEDHAHCPICSVMEQCENNIRTVGSGLILAVVSAMVYVAVAETKANFEYQSVQTTLVSQKVRLDN